MGPQEFICLLFQIPHSSYFLLATGKFFLSCHGPVVVIGVEQIRIEPIEIPIRDISNLDALVLAKSQLAMLCEFHNNYPPCINIFGDHC